MIVGQTDNGAAAGFLPIPDELLLKVFSELMDPLPDKSRKFASQEWLRWARSTQAPPPGRWAVWLMLAGRGFGKTRSGAEWVRHRVASGRARRIALVARTPADVRDVMIEGESGILNVSPEWDRPRYEVSKRRLTWKNGAIALAFSSHEPDQLRGPQFDSAWCDELAAWEYPRATWDNLTLSLRLGDDPRCVVTTTPRPLPVLRELLERDDVRVSRGSSYENRANLAGTFLEDIRRRYEGTRTGRQEIHAELLDEAEGALWRRDWIEDARVREAPELERVYVAIDPAVTSRPGSSETGIVVAGRDEDGHLYVLADGSGRHTPAGWAARARSLYERYRADMVIAETNNGGDMVEETLLAALEDDFLPFRKVSASRGKYARAEPVAALYEQGRVHHVGSFPKLEDQMCTWEPGSGVSPDRSDALVWAIIQLSVRRPGPMLY